VGGRDRTSRKIRYWRVIVSTIWRRQEDGMSQERAGTREWTRQAEAVALQRRFGVIQGCEATRPYALTPDFVRQLQNAGFVALNLSLAPHDARKGLSSETKTFMSIVEAIDEWHAAVEKLPGAAILPVRTVDDISLAKRTGRVALIFGLQGAGYWLDRKLLVLRTLHRLGVRVVGIAYMRRDIFAEGTGEKADGSLSSLGERLVKDLNRLGMVIDLSHMGRRASLEVMELSEHPVILSHSNVRALCPSPRNLTDEQIDAVAQTGSVIGLAALSPLVTLESRRPTVGDFIAHLDYIVQRVGPDHVGMGWEYAHARRPEDLVMSNSLYPDILGGKLTVETAHCEDVDGPQDMAKVTERLLDLGYPEDVLAKIFFSNYMRVFSQVWTRAGREQG